ncbi:MAG: ABC transporter substrate-binding protein [Alphaproteobacteria bacterium]|nr:ABC transporter substrate-binding protein [Alphaproteobacteria bacterium]
MRRRTTLALCAILAAGLIVAGQAPAQADSKTKRQLISPFFFGHSELSGALPKVERRLPRVPLVAHLGPKQTVGRHGGTLSLLVGRERDTRLMVVYGYARLVRYDDSFQLVPDILENFEVKEGRIFTLHLRPGHRWSDGHPFTAGDFKYYWEDVAHNPELTPGGLPKAFLVDGKPPLFEVLSPTTVRYTWDKPNPHFLPALAGAAPRFIFRPAHYLKRFHVKYAKPQMLKTAAAELRLQNWAALHSLKDNPYRFDNPDLPTLQPWRNTTHGPAQRFIFLRNPYFHRIDPEGRQLPYIDRVILRVSSPSLIAAKSMSGESDLQARSLEFNQYTFLKEGEKRQPYDVRLWKTARGAHLALYPNLNVADPAWRKLFLDVRFRRALSLGINRHEINQVLYFGLGTEGNNSVLPQSRLYEQSQRFRWAEFDPKRANRLLDEMGLTKRNGRGLRLLPDGRPLEIIVESSGEHTEQTDILELVHDSWLELGIKLYSKPGQREVLRKRVVSGQTMMSIWSGLAAGIATADISPAELAPTNPYQFHWPRWGDWYRTGGRAGDPPSLPAAKTLLKLYHDWETATSHAERDKAWRQMLEIHADEVLTFGLIAAIPQPVVVSRRLRNVPEEAIYSWDPGAYFGVYNMDLFWVTRGRKN